MQKVIYLSVFLFIQLLGFAQESDLTTMFERTQGKESDDYESTIRYCKMLEDKSDMVKLTSIGQSAQGRDIPLLIVNRNKIFDVPSIKNSSSTILMIQACIHPGEPDGKDAGLMLIRDIITKPELKPLADNVVILFLPVLNPDGYENKSIYNRCFQNGPLYKGTRTSAQNLNLNRDFSKLDSPEIQHWQVMYHQWNPDFFIDCHVTDGADYQYTVTYNFGIFGNMTPAVTNWAKNNYLNYITSEMEKDGNPISYYVEFKKMSDTRSGISSGIWGPMYSDEYVSVTNRPAFLIETHMYKDYYSRVTSTYEILRKSLIFLNKEGSDLKKLLKENDQYLSSEAFRKKPFSLAFELSKDSVMIDFRGYDYQVTKSDLTGGEWHRFNNKKPVTYSIPFFNKPLPSVSSTLPEAYIIPVEWADVIARTQLHGIKIHRLKNDLIVNASISKLSNLVFEPQPYEGRQRIQNFNIAEHEKEMKYLRGSAVVVTSQPMVQVIAHLLEAKGPVSYLSWGFFNTCFQVKERPENYIIEVVAHEMVKGNPRLLEELDSLKKRNTSFASDQTAILDWFYNQSKYADKSLNEYPIGKIYSKETLNLLLQNCQ
jgi:murein tripeptide amidase MpaA